MENFKTNTTKALKAWVEEKMDDRGVFFIISDENAKSFKPGQHGALCQIIGGNTTTIIEDLAHVMFQNEGVEDIIKASLYLLEQYKKFVNPTSEN